MPRVGEAGRRAGQRLPRPGAAPAQPPPLTAPPAAMSSGASVYALQRLVEQLKLEAGVERIKVRRRRPLLGRSAEDV